MLCGRLPVSLEQSIERQLAPLNSTLASIETNAINPYIGIWDKEQMKQAATRLREDIKTVNQNRLIAIDRLEKRCK